MEMIGGFSILTFKSVMRIKLPFAFQRFKIQQKQTFFIESIKFSGTLATVPMYFSASKSIVVGLPALVEWQTHFGQQSIMTSQCR
jgi:hypothetical protein